jgi:hypothetical protein
MHSIYFREVRAKVELTFHDNNTLSYKEPKTYVFVPDLSAGNENDTITSVNLLYVVGISHHLIVFIFNQSDFAFHYGTTVPSIRSLRHRTQTARIKLGALAITLNEHHPQHH